MGAVSTTVGNDVVEADWYAEVPRRIGKLVLLSILLITLTFGSFGVWATTAPLAAAVIAQGSFVATGRNKIVQHLEGGIIKSINITEGQKVARDEVLLSLDETSALSNQREFHQRLMRLEAMQARLVAQYERSPTLEFPPHLLEQTHDLQVANLLEAQTMSFNSTMHALENEHALLKSNIEALEHRALGYRTQLEATQIQKDLMGEELDIKTDLLSKGLIRRPEVTALQRVMAEADGQIGRLQAQIDEAQKMIDRYDTQIAQSISSHERDALVELEAVRAELESVREKTNTAESVLKRTDIRAPVSGTVVRLYYHTAGGVVESGKAIAEILPSDEPLIIEAQVPRTEIDSVHTGQEATVRLSALNQRTTPVLIGEVFYVSADALSNGGDRLDEKEVYITRISILPEELDRVPGFSPTPGMPAEIMIQTQSRTFLQYLVKPVKDSMSRAFREQ